MAETDAVFKDGQLSPKFADTITGYATNPGKSYFVFHYERRILPQERFYDEISIKIVYVNHSQV